ncbi:uncharacterized protein IUM83_18604 [Phytophthora cinnamomi]|uniref:uncharacterized protein n=1 Tax=Phytophthora cinnamomi TaxID=4785 RepID=UPI003559D7B8|nr:hypothetical protein IUM83_18604 [Phytophthora cinnamomi]
MVEDEEESDRSDEAVDPAIDESPTSAKECDEPDNELSSEAAVVDELPARAEDEDASTLLADELELVFEAVATPLEDLEVVPSVDPVVVLEPVVDPEAAVDALPAAELVLDVNVEPVVDDPGHTMVSPLHIWPLEQSLSVY